MKNISENEFYGFWSYALQLSNDQLKDGNFHTSCKGFYIERNPEVIYLFENAITGSKVLIANQGNIEHITKSTSLNKISIQAIQKLEIFNDYNFEFDDIDFFLNEIPSTDLDDSNLRQITRADKKSIDAFYKEISESDIDTLDLDFEDETTVAFAIYSGESIAAIGRYYIIPTEKGTMDITLATSKKYRGRGFASILLKKMLSSGLESNFIPRYRVKTDNIASIKVAEKLGFKKYCHIQALYPKESQD